MAQPGLAEPRLDAGPRSRVAQTCKPRAKALGRLDRRHEGTVTHRIQAIKVEETARDLRPRATSPSPLCPRHGGAPLRRRPRGPAGGTASGSTRASGLLSELGQDQAQPEVVVAVVGPVVVADRRPQVPRVVVPAAAADHPVRASADALRLRPIIEARRQDRARLVCIDLPFRSTGPQMAGDETDETRVRGGSRGDPGRHRTWHGPPGPSLSC
jgi:hypothetical protein